jgi:hypothetical protein
MSSQPFTTCVGTTTSRRAWRNIGCADTRAPMSAAWERQRVSATSDVRQTLLADRLAGAGIRQRGEHWLDLVA